MNNIILFLTDILNIYIVYGYMTAFFGKSRFTPKKTFVIYVIPDIVILFAQYSFPYIGVNVLSMFLYLLVISFCYRYSFTKRLTVVIIIQILGFVSEAIVAGLIGLSNVTLMGEADNYDAFIHILTESIYFVFLLLVRKYKHEKSDIPLPKYAIMLAFSVFASSSFLGIIVYSQKQVNGGLATAAVICMFLSAFLIVYLYDCLTRLTEKKVQIESINNEKEYYYNQSELLMNSYGETKKYRHNIKNQLYSLKKLIENNELDRADEYISRLTEEIEKINLYSRSGNIAIDSIVNYKLTMAAGNGADVKCNVVIPEDINIMVKLVVKTQTMYLL